MDTVQVDGIEAALGGADAAANALVLVHHRRAALEAAGRFLADLLLRERAVILRKLALDGHYARILAGAVVVAFHHNILLVELDEIPPVAADGHVTALHEAVQGLRSLLAGGNGVNRKLGTGEDVAAHKDVRLCRLVGEFVGNGIHTTEKFHLGVLEKVFQDNRLADGENHQIRLKGDGLRFVVLRGKLVLCVEYGSAFFEDDAAHLVRAQDLLGTPAGIEHHAVFAGLCALLQRGGHNILCLK